MEQFIEQLKNNAELKEKFMAFMHEQESSNISEGFQHLTDMLNKQTMSAIKNFADKEGISLSDSENIKDAFSNQCREMANQMNKLITEQFKKMLS